MPLKFITGNKHKFTEIKSMLSPVEVEHLDIDLAEIQSLDPREIMEYKLKEALKHQQGEFMFEDTSLYLHCLNDQLPGPLVKWFLGSIGASGIAEVALRSGDAVSRAVTIIGYANKDGEIQFFEGMNQGRIVSPAGDKDFGWGPIFKPTGFDKTYGQMEREEKYSVSMRAIAANKLKDYLLSNR